MTLPSQRWLRVIFLATAIIFVAVAVYLYGLRFFAWLESDAAVTALLGEKALHARSPVVADWYYANGDIWIIAPQLLAIIPVAVLGLGPPSLLVAVVLGFVLEIVVLVKLYARLAGVRWLAVLAAMATLMAWSNAHVAYAYIQLAYGLGTTLYLASFAWFAALAEDAPARPARWAGAALLVATIAAQNPSRGLVFVVAPLLAGCLWPWRAFDARRRLALAATAAAAWALAYVVYTQLLSRFVAFSTPRGHTDFVLGGLTRIKANLATLGHGLSLLYGDDVEPGLRLIPCALLIAGAVALVAREVFGSRAFTALRFTSMVVVAQLGIVLAPLIVGNLLDGPLAVRYLMPSVLAMFGLAVVIAVRALTEASRRWRQVAIGYLVALPLTALLAIPGARPPEPTHYLWPDAAELSKVADQLVERGLTHGFADNLAANLLTLDSHGAALTCRIRFRNVMMPERWLASTSCYDASALPDRFYVVAYQGPDERSALRATLPPEIERFSTGDTYEVHVYRTRDAPHAWLDLPLPDGNDATFPLRVPATHLQLLRDKVAVESGDLVATGQAGTVLSGPNLELPRGRYTATWIGRGVTSSGEVAFSVTSRGRRVLARTALDATRIPAASGELVRLAFTVERPQNRIEFPIESTGGGRVSLHELVIEKAR
jgi:hypothetical protein